MKALCKGFDEHVGDGALTRVTGALLRYVVRPKVESALSVLADPHALLSALRAVRSATGHFLKFFGISSALHRDL